jgi:RNA polymerase sigma factor (sigma-70 family)
LASTLAHDQYRRCGRTVPLDELLGEAALALAYAASLYDASKAVPVGAWLTLVIRHRLVQAVTAWRRGGRLGHVRFSDLEVPAASEDGSGYDPVCRRTREPVEEAGDLDMVQRVRQVMPERWFELLHLYYVEGHTLEEIGNRFGLSRERVRQVLSKALARARRHWPSQARGA